MLITPELTKPRQLSMSTAINYTDSYDSLPSNHMNRTGSSRQYVSSIQRTGDVDVKPIATTTPAVLSPLKDNSSSTIFHENYDTIQPSRRLHSSTSLSSTGYDSNSSPSIKSKRNSIATNNSNDCLMHSTYSSSSSSSSPLSDDLHQQHHQSKSWIQQKSTATNPTSFSPTHEHCVFDSSNEPSPLISRTHIKLNPPVLEQRPGPAVRYAIVRNATFTVDSPSTSSTIHEPIIGNKKAHNSSYTVQTTSFLNDTDSTVDKKIRRWNNIYSDRRELVNAMHKTRKYPLISTNSTGFAVMQMNNEQQQLKTAVFDPIIEHKQMDQREESPISVPNDPVFDRLPPKKPPRIFRNENKTARKLPTNDQKVPTLSSSSDSNSPSFDLGARSSSCMNLTAGASSTALSSSSSSSLFGLRTPKHERYQVPRRSSVTSEKTTKKSNLNENISAEIKIASSSSTIKITDSPQVSTHSSQSSKTNHNDIILRTPLSTTTKTKMNQPLSSMKSIMKKGVSEPNLTKTSGMKSPFSPRGILDRFKRMLPLTSSKQSLNEKTSNPNDSDDSTSTSSETTNDHIRTSRLDHVSRVKTVYDSLGNSSHMSSLLTDPNLDSSTNELTTLYEYVIHIVPEQEIGYFSHGTGCLSSSNIHSSEQVSTSTSIRFKYPMDANDETTLKYFCFPDQHDSNNNPLLLTKKTTQEYFRFILTNMHGTRQYGYCSRFFHKGILNALCIVSPYDMIEIYEKILSTATELFISYKDDDARRFLIEIYPHQLPSRGDTIHIDTSTVGLYTLKCEQDRRKELIDSVTLLSLSTETIIKIFSAILYEQKVIFISNDLGPLTRLINTFICLLYPFSWPHTYVPILPALMLDIIQAPTPYIIGILRSCEPYLSANEDLLSQDNSDIIIVDIDHDRIRSINDYITGNISRGSTDNLHNLQLSHSEPTRFQILPKIFKIELKQEISLLRKTKLSLSLDECQQRLRDVFMSIFVQSCYNYKDYYYKKFQREDFLQSKQHTIELFLEWFTRTQIFELFIRQKFELAHSNQFARTFDFVCEKYSQTMSKQIASQRMTAKSVKRKSATRTNKQENRF
ncbi:hypothetical protein I4U23_007771 [Adineta vaga]|nr:hypothetical protein I4U23_007771 [Adineta vaga]